MSEACPPTPTPTPATKAKPKPKPKAKKAPPPPTPRESRTVIVAYTHALRRAAMLETQQAFENAGLPIHHIRVQTEPPRQARNRRNAADAIKHALEHIAPAMNATGILIIEDDIIPSPELPAWLQLIEDHDRPTTLYIPNGLTRYHPQRLERVASGHRKATKGEIITMTPEALRGWWGAQAVWLPIHLARMVINDRRVQAHEHTIGPWDHALRTLLLEQSATLDVTVPDQVQHRGLPNLVLSTKRTHRSHSYDGVTPPPAKE